MTKRQRLTLAQAKYERTAKGRATRQRYEQSEKGKAVAKRYRESAGGRKVHAKYDRSRKGLARSQRYSRRRIWLGGRRIATATTLTQKRTIQAHIRQRTKEFQCRFRETAAKSGSSKR